MAADRNPTSAVQHHHDVDTLVLEHQELVRSVARRCARRLPRWTPLEDLIADGNVGLVKAAQKFDPSRDMPFRVWAQYGVQQAIYSAHRRRNYQWETLRDELPEVDPVAPETPDDDPLANFREVVERALPILDESERVAVLATLRGESLDEIGAQLELSESAACLVRQTATAKLRMALECCGYTLESFTTC